MHPMKRIEVEPLSEPRWSKIESSVFEKLDRERLGLEPAPRMRSTPPARSWRWRPAVALVMAGAMAAAVGALATRSIWVSPVSPVASGPSRIVTSGSDSHLALGDSEVDVAPDSAVLVSGDDERGMLLVLDHGKVDCQVAPRAGRPAFVVQAGDVRVRVTGTRFSVARDPQGSGAHVLVAMGVVEVTSHGETTTVHAGESWPAATKTAIAPPPVNPPAPTVAQPEPSPSPVAAAPPTPRRGAGRHPSRPSTTRPLSAPWPGSPSSSAADVSTAPLPAPVNAPPPPSAPTPQSGASQPAAPSAASPAVAAPPPATVPPPPVAAPPPAAAPPPPSAQDLYEAAARIERQNPEDALMLYRRVASGGGAWAANALYAAGRLQADRGRRADAQRLLNEYLTRFPNGPNARDAKDLLDKMR